VNLQILLLLLFTVVLRKYPACAQTQKTVQSSALIVPQHHESLIQKIRHTLLKSNSFRQWGRNRKTTFWSLDWWIAVKLPLKEVTSRRNFETRFTRESLCRERRRIRCCGSSENTRCPGLERRKYSREDASRHVTSSR